MSAIPKRGEISDYFYVTLLMAFKLQNYLRFRFTYLKILIGGFDDNLLYVTCFIYNHCMKTGRVSFSILLDFLNLFYMIFGKCVKDSHLFVTCRSTMQ